jgi:hypothetical protein
MQTTMDVVLTITDPAKFDAVAYAAAVATAAGVDASAVEVGTVTFNVTASYSVDLTTAPLEADVATAMAGILGVPAGQITVSITAGRRLRARRLAAYTFDATASTTDAATATAVSTAAADTTKLSTFTIGSETVTPTVAVAPSTTVTVTTMVKSTSGTAVVAPSATAINDAVAAGGGDMATAVTVTGVANVVTETVTTTAAPAATTTTAADSGAESARAPWVALTVAMATVLTTMA